MKSSVQELQSRGFLEEGAENAYFSLQQTEKYALLFSKIPLERTAAARLFRQTSNTNDIAKLVQALVVEKKLYTKIELCNTLVSCGINAVEPLICELGKIGNNQHTQPDSKDFKKDSYPLPRDIAARTLAHIGKVALPKLLEVLHTSNLQQLSEAIDAIGFICYYFNNTHVYHELLLCYKKHEDNNLIAWKIIRAMSAFKEAKQFLEQQKEKQPKLLQTEINRSLRLLEKRK